MNEAPLRVLIVEDDDDLRDLYAGLLLDHGAQVECAANAERAMELVGRAPFDLVLVDHVLAGMTGAELVAWVRTAGGVTASAPVVGISGRLGSEQALMAAGASCFVQKPADEAAILKAIRWALEVYRADRVLGPMQG